MIKTLNIENKERILKAEKKKEQVTYKGLRITPDLLIETLKVRRAWTYVLTMLRDHRCQPGVVHTEKFPVSMVGESKIFSDNVKM